MQIKHILLLFLMAPIFSYALEKNYMQKKTTRSIGARRQTSTHEISMRDPEKEGSAKANESILTKKLCVSAPFFDAKIIFEALEVSKITQQIVDYPDGNTRTETTCFFKPREEENEYQLTQIIDTLKDWHCCIHTSNTKRYASQERSICPSCKDFFEKLIN